MQRSDSIKSGSTAISRPKPIQQSGSVNIVVPNLDIADNIPISDTSQEQGSASPVITRTRAERKGVELNSDSTQYLIIAQKSSLLGTKSENKIFEFSNVKRLEVENYNDILGTLKHENKNISSLDSTSNSQNNTKKTETVVEDIKAGNHGIKTHFAIEQQDGVFALLLVCFFFFSYILKDGITFFKESSRFLFSERKQGNSLRETTITVFWYNVILLFQSILISAIIIFNLFLEKYDFPEPAHYFTTIVLIILAIYIFVWFKVLCHKLWGYIYDIQAEIASIIRSDLLLLQLFGIIAFIPTLMLVYSNNFHDNIFVFLFILFIITRLIVIYRSIVNFLHKKVNFLFLIIYLCTIEIIPYFFLYKGLILLYKLDITGILLWH